MKRITFILLFACATGCGDGARGNGDRIQGNDTDIRQVFSRDTVVLDPSRKIQGQIVECDWRQTQGIPIDIPDSHVDRLEFQAPEVSQMEVLGFAASCKYQGNDPPAAPGAANPSNADPSNVDPSSADSGQKVAQLIYEVRVEPLITVAPAADGGVVSEAGASSDSGFAVFGGLNPEIPAS